jgi:hypothetical protein
VQYLLRGSCLLGAIGLYWSRDDDRIKLIAFWENGRIKLIVFFVLPSAFDWCFVFVSAVGWFCDDEGNANSVSSPPGSSPSTLGFFKKDK